MNPPVAAFGPLGTTQAAWVRFRRETPHREVIAFDVPDGPGSSLTDAVVRARARLGGEAGQVDVLGVGFGSCLALGLALDHPAMVRRLVVAAPTARPGRPELWRARAIAVKEDGLEAHAHEIVGRWGGTSLEQTAWAQALSTIDPRWYAAACVMAAGIDLVPRLGEITCATLVVTAGADATLGPEHAAAISTGIPAASRIHLPDAGHLAMTADGFSPSVLVFLDA